MFLADRIHDRSKAQSDRKLAAVVDRRATGHRPLTYAGHRITSVADNRTWAGTPLRTASARPTTSMPGQVMTRARWQRRYVTNLQITDAIVVGGAVILAQYSRFAHVPSAAEYPSHRMMISSALFATAWLLALACFHTRSTTVIGAGNEEYRRVLAASIGTFGVIAMASLVLRIDISRGYIAVALPIGILGLLLSRWLWRRYVARKRVVGGYQTSVLALGESDAVANLANELVRDPEAGYRVVAVGITGYGPPRGEHLEVNHQKIPIVGGETHVLDGIRICGADTVAIAGAEHFGVQGVRRLIWTLESMGVDLMLSPGVVDVAVSRLVMRPIAGLPMLHVEKPQYRGAMRFCKRAFDFCFAAAVLTVALPILLVAAIAIKVGGRGPVFYCSERIGIDGRPFSMLKLRTMVVDADKQLGSLLDKNESDGLLFKIREDPRVTSVGRFLRRFSIDELPQFINVLRQEMSVVGPRPPLKREVDAYDSDIRRRMLVKPGITGLWQVSGRSDLSWEESIRLDLWYVDNWSMVEDILIIAKTLRAVFRRSGAY
jgi:exopolysaccharide biosynthesis polyprenyl glycosylphosphotransferase